MDDCSLGKRSGVCGTSICGMVSGDEVVSLVKVDGLGTRPKLLRRGSTADVGDGGSMEGIETAEVREGWACEAVEGGEFESGGTTFCLRVGERGSVRREITWRWTDCRRMASSRSRCRAEMDMNADCVLASWKVDAISRSFSKAFSAALLKSGHCEKKDLAAGEWAMRRPCKMTQSGNS